MAKTPEEAGNPDDAVDFAQQALDHLIEQEGAGAWWSNRERLDLASVPH